MESKQHMNYQRKKTATIVMILVLVLSITGTFAWYSISQRALNEGELTRNPGGRVHDDYHFQNVLNEVSDVANKDIYAENFGEASLLVRIKVSEYLEIDNIPVTGGNKEDRSTWVPYVLGNTERARNFVEWQMGGDKIFLPTFNTDKESLETDAKGDAIDKIAGKATGIGDGTQDYFTEGEEYTHPDYPGEIRTAKSTIEQERSVMSMQAWIEAERPIGNFWVVDADGWAYWANFLETGEATSLLVDEIKVNSAMVEGEMYYATDAIGEFSTTGSIHNFYNGSSEYGDASRDAQDLIDAIIGVEYALEVPEDVILYRGESKALTGTVIRETPLGERTEVINAKIEYTLSGISTVTEDGVVTIVREESEETLLLEIKAPEYNIAQTVRITVPTLVIPNTAGETFTDENGVDWRVLLPDDGNGNALLITEYVHNLGIQYELSDTWVIFDDSNLRTQPVTGMNAWYASNVGRDIKSNALHYLYPNGGNGVERNGPQVSGWGVTANVVGARTLPGEISTIGDGQPFALSISEANHYFENADARLGTSTSGVAHNWWLRSPGNSNHPTSFVFTDGTMGAETATDSNVAFRAALWVRR